ncbi:LptA/OstA family protein [Succinispira mobilis]|uniref:LptA/OstA family protein n=1 Tax=Succinispira mobilis TaxID=78120 RepID=UPI000381EA35|nr:LptA/OstA family protein [Succinispira mobilis]
MKKKLAAVLTVGMLCATLVSAQTTENQPVEISGDTIEYNSKTQITTAVGNVNIKRVDGNAQAARAEYNLKQEIGQLTGNVRMQYNDVTIKCETLDLLAGKHLIASGGDVYLTKAGDTLNAAKVEYFDQRKFAQTIGDWAKLTTADASVLTAEYISYDMQAGQAIAERQVKIDAPARKLIAAGDHAVYLDNKAGREPVITLTGNAWAIQDGNKITGNTLIFKTESSEGEAKGKVVLQLPPQQKTKPSVAS